MNTQNIVDHIIDNGGITYNLRNQSMVTTGYAVSARKDLEQVIPLESFTVGALESYIVRNNEILAVENNMLGAWMSEGMVYLDVTTVVSDESEAVRIAKSANQLAIFNLETFEEIATV